MSRLQEKLDEINRQKLSYIKPENLRQGVTAFGVEGAMTSENMWTPIYANNGDYYILSFVSLDGNNNPEKIIGYDGFRIVKFTNSAKYYLFDVRMNKPKQITDSLPVTTHLLGYTEDYVYTLNATIATNPTYIITKTSIVTGESTTVFNATVNQGCVDEDYYRKRSSSSYKTMGPLVKDFYIFSGNYGSSNQVFYNGGAFRYYDITTDTFTTYKTFASGASSSSYTDGGIGFNTNTSWESYCYGGSMQIIGDYILMWNAQYGSGDYKSRVCMFTKSNSTFTSAKAMPYAYLHGFAPSGNYVFFANKIYNFDIATRTTGAEVGSTPFGSTTRDCIIWISNTFCIYADQLYTWDESTFTFTKVVNTTFYPFSKMSSTFVDVIVGYSFLGQNYYFNIGNPIIQNDKIVAGYFARDQYNQVVQGTLENNGQLHYTPSTSSQSIPAGLTTGGVIDAVTYEIDADIKPENIRYGVNILGIAGTLEQDAAESVMSQEEYDACINVADAILGISGEEEE